MLAFIFAVIAYVLAGLGLGGGILFIPLMVNFLKMSQTDAGYLSLIAYIPAAITICFLSRNFKTIYRVARLIPFGILGAIIGAVLAKNINVDVLKGFYSVFMIAFGTYLCISNTHFLRKKH